MKNFNISTISDNEAVAVINSGLIRTGIADYLCHTNERGAIDDIGDDFIGRLAYDSAVAKAPLRNILRIFPNWNESTQRAYINGTTTSNPDWARLDDLARKIMWPTYATADDNKYFWLNDARRYFTTDGGTARESCQDALRTLAPKAFNSKRKLSRKFRIFCQEIGIDLEGNEDNRKLFATFADELNERKLDFRFFISINASDFHKQSD